MQHIILMFKGLTYIIRIDLSRLGPILLFIYRDYMIEFFYFLFFCVFKFTFSYVSLSGGYGMLLEVMVEESLVYFTSPTV